MVDESVNECTPVLGEDRVAADAGANDGGASNGVEVTEKTPGAGAPVEYTAHTGVLSATTDVVNALELYDRTSQVSATIASFPATIGNADDCDLALKGPGPEGVYLRVRCERDVFVAQLVHTDVTFSVNDRPLQSVILMDGDTIVLGDHEVRVRFTHAEPPQPAGTRRRTRRWRWIAGLGAAALALIVIWQFSAMGAPDRPSLPAVHTMPSDPARRPDRDRSDVVEQSSQQSTARVGRDATAQVGASSSLLSLMAETTQPQRESVEPRQAPASRSNRVQTPRAKLRTEVRNDHGMPTAVQVSPSVSDAMVQPEPMSPAAPKHAGRLERNSARQSASQITRAQRRENTATVLQHVRESYAKNGADAAAQILRSAPSNVDTDRLASASAALQRARRAQRRAQQAAADGDLEALTEGLQMLIRAEHALGLNTASRGRQKIGERAVVLYQRAAQRALDRGVRAQAYRWYQRVLAIHPDNAAAQTAVEHIVARARRWYLQGYKLEYRSLKSAIECWRRVVRILPPSTHWHQLAQAKLYEYRDFEAL